MCCCCNNKHNNDSRQRNCHSYSFYDMVDPWNRLLLCIGDPWTDRQSASRIRKWQNWWDFITIFGFEIFVWWAFTHTPTITNTHTRSGQTYLVTTGSRKQVQCCVHQILLLILAKAIVVKVSYEIVMMAKLMSTLNGDFCLPFGKSGQPGQGIQMLESGGWVRFGCGVGVRN